MPHGANHVRLNNWEANLAEFDLFPIEHSAHPDPRRSLAEPTRVLIHSINISHHLVLVRLGRGGITLLLEDLRCSSINSGNTGKFG